MRFFLPLMRWAGLVLASITTHATVLGAVIVYCALLNHGALFPGSVKGGAMLLREGAGKKGLTAVGRSSASTSEPVYCPGPLRPTVINLPQQTPAPPQAILPRPSETQPALPQPAAAKQTMHRDEPRKTSIVSFRRAPLSAATSAPPISLAAGLPAADPSETPVSTEASSTAPPSGQSGRRTAATVADGTGGEGDVAGLGRGAKGDGRDAYDSALGAGGNDEGVNVNGNAIPPYPEIARLNRWSGRVLLRIVVEADGRVSSAAVVQTSGRDVLDEAARTTVLTWRAIPARRYGQAVRSVEILPVDFRLP